MTFKPLALLAGALVGALPASAHHSFATTYSIEGTTTRIEGNVVDFVFQNPHSFVHLVAPDADGRIRRWTVEWGSVSRLTQRGVTGETLKPGDHVLVAGAPGRNPADYKLLMRGITRPKDGWTWGAPVQ